MNALFKKTLAVLLSAILLLTAIPFAASAATVDEAEQSVGASSGTTGDCTWTLDDNGTLTISGNGAMGDYSNADSSIPWRGRITSVIINDGVTSIGNWAFSDCYGLTSVTIPDSVTSIGEFAFFCCYGLTSFTIGNSVTSIGQDAFCWCYGLTSVTIGNGVTSIGDWAFFGCYGLTSISVDENNAVYDSRNDCNAIIHTADNTLIAGCQNTVIPDSVTSIADCAFYYCTGLTSVIIPDSVASIGSEAFENCTGLTSVHISDIAAWCNIAFSSTYSNPLYYAHNLYLNDVPVTDLIIPDSVTSIGNYAFRGCTGLTSVTIPDSVTSIGDKALGYYYNNGYKKIAGFTIYGKQGSEAQRYANDNDFIFEEVSPEEPTQPETQSGTEAEVTEIELDGDYYLVGYIDGADYNGTDYKFTEGKLTATFAETSYVCIKNADGDWYMTSGFDPEATEAILYKADSENWEKLMVPAGKATFTLKAYSDGTYKLSYVTEEITTDEPTQPATDEPTEIPYQSGTTGECAWTLDNNGTLTISGNGAMGNYSSSSTAPWGTNIKTVVIEDGVTSIGYEAFRECTGLTSVTIGNSVTSISNYAFNGCVGLTSVTIPNSVTSIGVGAFSGCTGLTDVTIGNSVTSIGNYVFYNCTGLTSVTIPNSVKSIGTQAFQRCTGLTSVIIPNSVTSIGYEAFRECPGLTSVTIPNSVKSIGDYALGYYYNNGNKKVSGFTIYGKRGSKAQGYADDNGFIFEELSPGEPSEPTEPEEPVTVIVAGSEAEIFGTGWDGTNEDNLMTKQADGTYTKEYTVEMAYDAVQLKAVVNGAEWIGDLTGNNITFNLKEAGTFTVIYHPAVDEEPAYVEVTGDIVEFITELDYDTVYAVGNGEGMWLNGAAWDPAYAANEMTEIADDVWEIKFADVPDGFERQIKFAIDGAWTHNFGGVFEDSGVQSAAVYNGDNITFDTEDVCTVKAKLDLRNFNYTTKQGAKFTVTIIYEGDEEETSAPIIEGGLTLTATSNISPETTTHFSSSRLAEQNNYITVSYCVQSEMKLVNCDWLLTYDGTALQFNEAANTVGTGKQAKLDIMRCVDNELVNTSPNSVEYGISGNCTDLNAYYLNNENGGRVAFVTVTFKVIGPGSTTVDLRVGDMRLTNKMWGESTVDYETQAVLDGAVLTDTLPDFDTRVYLGKYNEDYIVGAEAPTEPTEEPTIDPDTILDYGSVYAVGNGKGTWLNSISWRPSAASNQMTEIAEDVWKIVYSDVPAGNDYQVRFAIDGAWTHSFGGVFKGSGVVSDAVYDGDNITFNTHTDCDIIIRLDLSDFNLKTKEGAKFTVTIEDYVEETTAAVEETTEAVEETTEAVEETTEAVEETTEAVEDTTAPVVEDDTLIVAGSEAEIFGTGWDATNEDNLMTKQADGTYTKEYTVEKAYDAVQLKAVKNGADWIGDKTGNNVIFNVTGEGTFTVTYYPAAGEEPEYVDVTGTNVEAITTFDYNTVYAVGNGEGTWLNGVAWEPGNAANEMTKVADDLWEISFDNVPDGFGRQIKFAIDGAWTHNFGGAFEASGVETVADYNGDNITFDTDDVCTVKVQLDLRDFDFVTKEGAKFTITITYDDVEETTEAYEETTANPEETTAPVEEGTTEAYEETTAPVEEGTTEAYEETTANYEETTSHVEDTTSVPANSLIVKATSNLFPQTVNAYNNLSAYENGNGDVFVTVEYKLAAPGQYLINLDVEELSWDPAVLEFKEAYNIMGYGRQAKFTIFPFAYEQGLGAGMVNTFGDDNGGRLEGNYTSVLPAAYATEEDNVSPVTVVRAVFKVLDREAGVTTVDCLFDGLALCDDTIAEPYVQHRLVYNGVVDQDILDNCTVQTIIKPEGQVEPPVEETTTPEETTEAVEETTEAYEETTAPAEEGTTEYYEATTCVPEYCTVSGISNYCQAVAAREIEVGDTVTVSFKAPEDGDIVDIQWGMNYDKDLLQLTGISTFDGGPMLINTSAESFNVLGSLTDINDPYHVDEGDDFIVFIFTAKAPGNTTVDLCVVDMMVRVDGEDYIRVENGEIKSICTHKTTRTIPGYPATCTQAGLTDEIVCAECGKVMTKAVAIPAKGHTPVVDQAKAATCTETGLTEGSHCSVCNQIIIAQEVIPANGHTAVKDKAKAATCTETGLTEGSHCSVCNEVLVEQIEIPALGHLPVLDPYLAPTCSHEGHTAGSYCARCSEVFVQTEPIAKLPHTVVTDEAVEPSCGHTGLTEGSHCSVCGEVIVAQDVIPALKHQYEIVPAVPATYTKEGSTDGVRCKRCGEWLIAPQVIPKKPIDFTFGDVNEDGKVNIRDVTAIQRFLAEYTDLTERQRGAADVNFDGVVDVRDATLLQMYFAEFDVTLG